MNVFKQFQTFIIGIIFWKTDAAVTVETGNSVASFVCGNSENIICTITPFGGTMTWQIGVIPAASCSSAGCSTNSMFSADYTFKFNETAGVFDLIINNVTLSVNNTEFSCDDGLTSDVIKASVTVTDDFQTFDNESSFDSSTNQTELKVTTGCLTDDTASKVKFIWYYLKVNDSGSGVRVRNDSAENEAKTENDSKCLADPDCGSSGFRQVSSVLTLTEVDDGDFYTFEVVIDYGTNVETSVSFYDQFKLKYTTTTTPRVAQTTSDSANTTPNTTETNSTFTRSPDKFVSNVRKIVIIVVSVVGGMTVSVVLGIIVTRKIRGGGKGKIERGSESNRQE